MISKAQFDKEINLIIANAIREDVGDGDHSSLACIPKEAQGKAKLLVKAGLISYLKCSRKRDKRSSSITQKKIIFVPEA